MTDDSEGELSEACNRLFISYFSVVYINPAVGDAVERSAQCALVCVKIAFYERHLLFLMYSYGYTDRAVCGVVSGFTLCVCVLGHFNGRAALKVH